MISMLIQFFFSKTYEMMYNFQLLIACLLFMGIYTEKLPNIVLFVSDDQDIVLNGMVSLL